MNETLLSHRPSRAVVGIGVVAVVMVSTAALFLGLGSRTSRNEGGPLSETDAIAEGFFVAQGEALGFSTALAGLSGRGREPLTFEGLEIAMTPGLEWLGALVVPADAVESGLSARYHEFPPEELRRISVPLEGYRLAPGEAVHVILGFRVRDQGVNGFGHPAIRYRAGDTAYRRVFDYVARLCPEAAGTDPDDLCQPEPLPELTRVVMPN